MRNGGNDFWHASYFPELDGLRTLSLLLVIGFHIRTTLPIKHYFDGVLGVNVFFVISGFLITTLLLRERRAKGSISIRSFYTRRAFRIIPMYAFTLLLYLGIGNLPSQQVLKEKIIRALPYDLTLRNEYIPANLEVAFTHSWSLSVEEKFYVVWPLLLLLLIRRSRYQWAIVPLTFAPLLVSCSGHLSVGYFSIMLGCSVSLFLEALTQGRASIRDRICKVPTLVWFVIWAAGYLLSLDGSWRFASAVTTALLLPKLLVDDTWLSRALGARILQWVGKRTYSMYLLHAFCLSIVEDHLIRPDSNFRYCEVLGITFVLCLAVASVTYSLIEVPLIRLGRRIAERTTDVAWPVEVLRPT